MNTNIKFNKSYKLNYKNYYYTIEALEINNKDLNTSVEEEEETFPFTMPYIPPALRKVKKESQKVVSSEFLIMIGPSEEVYFFVEGLEGSFYKVLVRKIKNDKIDEFKCMILRNVVEHIIVIFIIFII
jgi:hypothetical protein